MMQQNRSLRYLFMRMLILPVLAPIIAYRQLISPLLPRCCRFEPSCSLYALQVLRRYGIWHGGKLAVKRLLRCHPWGGCGYDPAPTEKPLVERNFL